MSWNDRPKKEIARQLATYTESSPAPTYLSLPGIQLLDVKAAMEQGSINKRTLCLWAEHNPLHVSKITREGRRLGFTTNPYLHIGPLETFYLPPILEKRSVDLAFLDYCGPLHEVRLLWLRDQLMPHLAVDSVVSVTVQLHTRRSRFMPRFVDEVLSHGAGRFMSDIEDDFQQTGRTYGQTVMRVCASLTLAMRDCRFELEDVYSYRERVVLGGGTAMGMLRFRVVETGTRDHIPPRLDNRFTRLLATRPSYKSTIRRYI